MKHSKKLLSILLILTLLFSSLASCSPEQAPDESSELTEPESTEEITTEAPESSAEFVLVKSGEPMMKIVRPAELKTADIRVSTALELRKYITKMTDVSLDLGDDWISQSQEYDSSAFEILIGDTAYPETAEIASELGYGEYTIRACGNKIVILSYSDKGYEYALNHMKNIIDASTITEADGTRTVSIKAEALNVKKVSEPMTASLPVFENSEFNSVVNMGDGCYGLILDGVTKSEYTAYVEKLTAEGYKTHATNQIAENLFATMYTEQYTVNVGYYAYNQQSRVIIEPYEDDTLAELPSNEAPITTSQLSMIGVEGLYNGNYQQNGLCLLYRLSDGRFVVVDGGHQNNSSIYANNLIAALREQSKDYAKTDKDITIAAWIITHPHSDHQGMFVEQYKLFTKFTIQSIMSNFWSEEGFNEAQNTTSTFAPGTYERFYKTYDIAKEIGADYIAPHVGQVYHFGDTKFEILYTIESFLPRVAASFNTSSIVFRSITTDASGKTTTAIITGDATGYAFAVCNSMYDKELKCDIMQVAHHGATTSGLSGQTEKAYKYMQPTTVLWPAGANYFPSVYENDYNHTLLTGQNPNYKETFVAGWQGNTVTLPLPYTVGEAIVKEVLEPKK